MFYLFFRLNNEILLSAIETRVSTQMAFDMVGTVSIKALQSSRMTHSAYWL